MTNVQKQCLLKYLGYYDGAVDGLWGPKSKQATVDFQRAYGIKDDGEFGPVTEKKILEAVAGLAQPVEPENFWDGIKYFDREEFRCKCGGKYCDGFPVEPVKTLVTLADRVREHFGEPMRVSSGVRCEVHNANVGGVSGSRHKLGTAMDFCIDDMPASVVLAYVHAQPEVRYAYAIDASYIHMDVVV